MASIKAGPVSSSSTTATGSGGSGGTDKVINVVVVGAGVAGLAAARAIVAANSPETGRGTPGVKFKVHVLEARPDRIGGRVHTASLGDCPVDMGAGWMHGTIGNPLAPMIRELGMATYCTTWENSVLYDHDLKSFAFYDTDGSRLAKPVVQDALDRFELLMDAICRMRDVWVSEIEGDHLFDADGDDADNDDADNDESLNAIATAAAHAALASAKADASQQQHKQKQKQYQQQQQQQQVAGSDEGTQPSAATATAQAPGLGRGSANLRRVAQPVVPDMSVAKALRHVAAAAPHLAPGVATGSNKSRNTPLDRALAWFMARMEGWFSAPLEEVSLRRWDVEEVPDGGHHIIVHGYCQLVEHLARGLNITRAARVTNVAYNSAGGVRITSADGSVIHADAAVIAIPLGVLKESCEVTAHAVASKTSGGGAQAPGVCTGSGIMMTANSPWAWQANVQAPTTPMPVKPRGGATSESPEVPDTCAVRFTPPLPAWKQRAIMQLGVGLENKVVIEFEEVFWPDVDFLGAVTNKPADCSYFLNVHRYSSPKRPVLACMPAGTMAIEWEQLPDKEVVSRVCDMLVTMLRLPSKPKAVRWAVSRWGAEPYTRGSYSYDSVGMDGSETYAALGRPVAGTLFFAGEHTSEMHPGTVTGAYESGTAAGLRLVGTLARRQRARTHIALRSKL